MPRNEPLAGKYYDDEFGAADELYAAEDQAARERAWNFPRQFFHEGDIVRMKTGMQHFKVLDVSFCELNGRYLVHAKFGPCHFWQWQEDVVRHG